MEGTKKEPILIIKAEPKDNYNLRLTFNNGDVKILDMNPSISKGGVFTKLKDVTEFNKVRVQYGFGGGLEWPSGADYCPKAAFMRSKLYDGKVIKTLKSTLKPLATVVNEEINKARSDGTKFNNDE